MFLKIRTVFSSGVNSEWENGERVFSCFRGELQEWTPAGVDAFF